MKKTLGKSRQDNLLDDVDTSEKIPLKSTVITTPEKMALYEPERKTARMQAVVTPSEREQFLELEGFGRVSESKLLRELVLMTIGKPTQDQKTRQKLLNLIDKNT